MLHDLKHAARMLWHSKGWTLVVLLSLALGIGATTALFTAVNGLLLQTVPVPDPGSLVRVGAAGENNMRRSSSDYGFSLPYEGQNVRASFSYSAYQAMREANQTLTDLAAFAPAEAYNLIVKGTAENSSSFVVSGNFFSVVRVPVAAGRGITPEDDRAGAEPVAVISHALWRRRFGSDPSVVGTSVRINQTPVTIVGVTAASYTGVMRLGGQAPDVTVPLALDPTLTPPTPPQTTRLATPTSWWLLVVGRLKPDVTYSQVTGNLEGPMQQAARAGREWFLGGLKAEERSLARNKAEGNAVPRLVVRSAEHGFYDADNQSRRAATIVSVVVTILLLIVCANVANLLLSRGAARAREIAVRLSMGASRWRLIRQLLTESLLLSGVGGLLGIVIAYWGKSLLPFGQNATIDAMVLAFVTGVSVLAGLLFGVVPAIRATRVELAAAMKESGRSVTHSRTWLGKSLLVLQVAMSLVLLIGAGLFLRTLHNLRSVDIGFNADHLLIFRINPSGNRYELPRIAQTYERTHAELSALPGVRSVALTRTTLLSGSESTTSMVIQGQTDDREMHVMSVSPQFLSTLEIPVLTGRGFTEHDLAQPTTVALINETAAKQYFGGDNPVGRRIGNDVDRSGTAEIVGVIRDTKYNSLRDAAPPTWYQLLPRDARSLTVVVRTAGDPAAMIETMRAAMHKVDPELPVTGVTTQTDNIENRVAQERLFALAYSLFGGLALLLACIGLFGLMSYSVSRRTNEIGIRMALGAQRSGVVGMVLRESMIMVAAGVTLGLAGALAAGRLIASVLFGLEPTDGWTIAAAIALMAAVSFAAGYLPARRASRVDPMVALRYE
ncbi:MAG TPA: ABC transporter permease [Vicinamibacterales bacterium]|nr:ABC transporter permease [Vicinamibacterales bacterium]